MNFGDVIKDLEAFAEKEWEVVKTEAIHIEQELLPVVETAFIQALQQFGQLAVQTVVNLMTAAYASLSGGEKLNLTVTTIVDAAEKQGIAIAEADATALAKNAYAAVIGKAPPASQ